MTQTLPAIRSTEQAVADARAMTVELIERRLRIGWSLGYLGRRAGFTAGNALNRLASGESDPLLDTYLRLHTALAEANQPSARPLQRWSRGQALLLMYQVRDERRRRGWGRPRVGEYVGAEPSRIARWEDGRTVPRLSTCLRLFDAVELPWTL